MDCKSNEITKEKVALLKCKEYDPIEIERIIRHGFEILGGDSYVRSIIPENSSVLLKPNMVSIENAGSIAVTNYLFFEGVIRVIRDYTSNISFGDSPGFGDPLHAANKCGLMDVAKKYNVKFCDFRDTVHVTLSDSLLCKSWNVARGPYEADVLITLPRLKTHAMAYFTGAVKNQFGCISGTKKLEWHTRMPDANNFCKMLLDLNTVVKTSYAIMDGIVAMQGNGPTNGEPYKLNSILMGKSVTAVDSVAVRLIGYKKVLDIPYLKEAYDSNWGKVLPDDIDIIGEKIDDLIADGFKLCRKGGNFYFKNPRATAFLKSLFAPNPYLNKEECIGCSRCESICPKRPDVIKMVTKNNKRYPSWNMDKCIRCFCCQELCPKGAIKVKNTIISKLFSGKLD